MKKPRSFIPAAFSLLFTCLQATAQEWKDVAAIFYDNCSSCHRPGEIGPFPIMSYADVANSPYLYSIPEAVNSGLMPPWKADPGYRHFLDERILSPEEKNKITAWVDAGAPAGDTLLAPAPPVFPEGSQLGQPDLVLKMAEEYAIPGDNHDRYICFVLPTNLATDQNVSAIEFRAGNGAAVHHVFLYLVEDSSAYYKDLETPDYGYESFGGAGEGVHANFIGLYGPGMVPRFYPAGGVVNFPEGSFFLIQVHYAPLTVATTDQSSVNLFFSGEPDPREIKATRIGESFITNKPFKIKAEQVDTFYSEVEITDEFSLFAIAPHQHLLGKSFKIFGLTPSADTIPLVFVPSWDFHWQLLYSYPFMLHLEPGTVVKAVAEYDNTSNNPYNPNDPPQDVVYGESSTDEMFKYLIMTLPYLPGDETIVIDSNYIPVNADELNQVVSTFQFYSPYPNPAGEQVTLTWYQPFSSSMEMKMTDAAGKLWDQRTLGNQAGFGRAEVDLASFPQGIYFVTIHSSHKEVTKSFLIQR